MGCQQERSRIRKDRGPHRKILCAFGEIQRKRSGRTQQVTWGNAWNRPSDKDLDPVLRIFLH